MVEGEASEYNGTMYKIYNIRSFEWVYKIRLRFTLYQIVEKQYQ